ncbi:hypothetical protein GF337_01895, partial [candidate division KSB1 bacterium]|nr:hypothetical protein [candidate division KSB1 bacterium]
MYSLISREHSISNSFIRQAGDRLVSFKQINMNLKKKGSVLLLCYYFPPMGMGGTQRSAKFAKYLGAFGWKPTVVTVKDVHYYAHDESLLEEIHHVEIVRTESLDPLRILARFKGHRKQTSALQANKRSFFNYLNSFIGSWLFIPDSKMLWVPFAIIRSLRLIRKKR